MLHALRYRKQKIEETSVFGVEGKSADELMKVEPLSVFGEVSTPIGEAKVLWSGIWRQSYPRYPIAVLDHPLPEGANVGAELARAMPVAPLVSPLVGLERR